MVLYQSVGAVSVVSGYAKLSSSHPLIPARAPTSDPVKLSLPNISHFSFFLKQIDILK